MQIPIELVIRADSAMDPRPVREYVERRLTFALRRFEHWADRVIVRLTDTNGPKRGVDSRCAISLRLRDGRRIDVQAVTAWPFASITRAAKRLNTVLRRELDKSHAAPRRLQRAMG